MEFQHKSVLKEKCMGMLNLSENTVIADCTCGLGGHSEEILGRTKTTRLICIDKDQEALDFAKKRLKKFDISYN